MFEWLKNHFIPHEGNGYEPHFLRYKIVGLFLGLILVVELLYLTNAFLVLPKSDYFAAILASVLVDQTNGKRQTENLGFLATNPKLEAIALMKAEDMAARGYFSHNTPEGLSPWYWFEKEGYDYAAAGENLAVNFVDSRDVTEAWMRSPTHRSNIMNGNYSEIGIATARGMYKGREAIFVVQMFGRPSSSVFSARRNIATATSTSAVTQRISAPIVLRQKSTTLPVKKNIATTTMVTVTSATSGVSTTMIVAGAETAKFDSLDGSQYEGGQDTPAKQSIWRTIIASPRLVTTTVLVISLVILFLAFGLAVFVHIRIQHPHIIMNGLFLLAIILVFMLVNIASGPELGVI